MIEHVADELDALVGEASIRLRDVPEVLAATKLRPERWSAKEILGHLVDSAANNHHRFIRAQQSDGGEFAFPAYEQDEWVRLQAYQERPLQEVIELWAVYNRHLAYAIRRIPKSASSVICRIGTNEPVTLRFLVEDYLVHLRHHLQQIRGAVADAFNDPALATSWRKPSNTFLPRVCSSQHWLTPRGFPSRMLTRAAEPVGRSTCRTRHSSSSTDNTTDPSRRSGRTPPTSDHLVLPWISAYNLASTILSRIARQVAPDWAAAYGVRPLLLETLVDPRRFDGACYRAANWIGVGTTTGRGRNDRHRRVVRAPKRVLIYPLVPDAAARLRGH